MGRACGLVKGCSMPSLRVCPFLRCCATHDERCNPRSSTGARSPHDLQLLGLAQHVHDAAGPVPTLSCAICGEGINGSHRLRHASQLKKDTQHPRAKSRTRCSAAIYNADQHFTSPPPVQTRSTFRFLRAGRATRWHTTTEQRSARMESKASTPVPASVADATVRCQPAWLLLR